jgi:hypothetical protein
MPLQRPPALAQLAPGASPQVALSPAVWCLTVLWCEEAVVMELDSIAFSDHLLGSLVLIVWTCL